MKNTKLLEISTIDPVDQKQLGMEIMMESNSN